MAKDILGLGTCAKVLGVGIDRIRHLIYTRKIKPKKISRHFLSPYKFTPEDQEIIRQHTSMRD